MLRLLVLRLLVGTTLLALSASATISAELLSHEATGWKYRQVPWDDSLIRTFHTTSFDGSDWSASQAAFGNLDELNVPPPYCMAVHTVLVIAIGSMASEPGSQVAPPTVPRRAETSPLENSNVAVLDEAAIGTGEVSEFYRALSRLPSGARIRVEQGERSQGFQRGERTAPSDVLRHDGLLVGYSTRTVTLAQEGRDAEFSIDEISRLYAHKGQAKKGALIGAVIGLAIATPMIISSVNASGADYGAVTGPMVFVLTTSLGAILGGVDHWVKVYPD
jgi:hypothetical protein